MRIGIIWNLAKKIFEWVSIRKNGIAVKIPLGEKEKTQRKKINPQDLSAWEKRK